MFFYVDKTAAQHEFMATIDPVTGAITRFDSIPGVMYIAPHAIFDDRNKHFLFIGEPPSQNSSSIYVLNAVTGKLISQALLPKKPTLITMKYNEANDQLYGLVIDAGVYSMAKINTSTGAYATIKTINEISSTGEQMLMDNAQNFLVVGIDKSGKFAIFTLDVNGNLLSSAAIPNIAGPQYDPVSNSIYALRYSGGINQLVRINPATGTLTTVGNLPTDFKGTIQYSNTFDKDKHHYILGSGSKVLSIDVSSAAIVHQPTAPASSNAVDKDNVINFRYSNSLKKIYALHWYAQNIPPATPQVLACASEADFKVHYNGQSNSVVVTKATTTCVVRMSMYNELGQELMTGRLVNDGVTSIQLTNYATGTYFISFYAGGRLLKGEKVFIQR